MGIPSLIHVIGACTRTSFTHSNSCERCPPLSVIPMIWNHLVCCTFEKSTKNILFDCSGVLLSPHFPKKPKFENDQESQENGTNMDIILLFLTRPLGQTWCCEFLLINRDWTEPSSKGVNIFQQTQPSMGPFSLSVFR